MSRATIFGALLAVWTGATLASGQAMNVDLDKDGALELPPAPHETWRDTQPPPPMELPVAPGRWISRDGVTSVQVNVNAEGLNIIGDAANEPSMAMDPTNPNRIVVGWRQFDSVLSDFRQAGWGYSHNGGATWTFPGKIEEGLFRSDPVVDSDANGVFYYNSLTNVGGFQCKVFRSFDGGVTWDAGAFAWGGDKQWQVIDTTGGPGNGNIYAAWNRIFTFCTGNQFTRSTDGGVTFDACTRITDDPYWGTLAVGPDGELYVCGRITGTGQFRVVRSDNAKFAGQTPTWTSYPVAMGGSIVSSTGPNPGGLLGQMWVDVDRSSGPRRGWVYALATIRRSSSTDPADIMFVRSSDGGATWTAPVRVNDDPIASNTWQWFGTMSVAPNGRIDAVWLDTRNNPGTFLSELYYSYSDDGGQSWAPGVSLSPAFDPHLGWPQQNKMGDYFDMTSLDDAAYLAYAATFNGEQDVYFVRITRQLNLSLVSNIPTLVPHGQPLNFNVVIRQGNEGLVPGSAKVHYRYHGDAFKAVELTPVGGDLYQASLPPVYCGADIEFYFSAEGTESGITVQPAGAPGTTYTTVVGQINTLHDFPLDDNPGWQRVPNTTQNQWAFGDPAGLGGAAQGNEDPQNGFTGTNVFGVNLNGDYFATAGGPYHIVAGPLDLSGATQGRLEFQRWLNTDHPPYVTSSISGSIDNANWSTIWQHTGTVAITDAAWNLQSYDIAAFDGQPNVWLRWSYQVGSGAFAYSGWNIDDIRIKETACDGAPRCAGDMNCDGVVSFGDIDLFVDALGQPLGAGWTNADCPWLNADANADNAVDFGDIDPFVARIGATCP